MRMTFFWTPDLGAFFFQNLKVETVSAVSILCGVLVLFSLLYEGIKVDYDQKLRLYDKINNALKHYFFSFRFIQQALELD